MYALFSFRSVLKVISFIASFVLCSVKSPGHDVEIRYRVSLLDVHVPDDLHRQDRQDAFRLDQGRALLTFAEMLVNWFALLPCETNTHEDLSGAPCERHPAAFFFCFPYCEAGDQRYVVSCSLCRTQQDPTGKRHPATLSHRESSSVG